MSRNTLVLTIVVALCTASVVRAQSANAHIATVNAYADVASASFSGSIVIGLPLVGFIQDPVVHGHWGWPLLTLPEQNADLFQKTGASQTEASTANVVVQPGTTASDLRVVDHMGRLVQPYNYTLMSDGTVDLSGVTSGVYTVMEIHDATVRSHRIMIVR